jgi:hypothetical protein
MFVSGVNWNFSIPKPISAPVKPVKLTHREEAMMYFVKSFSVYALCIDRNIIYIPKSPNRKSKC